MSTRERDNRRLLRRIREYHTASDSVMGAFTGISGKGGRRAMAAPRTGSLRLSAIIWALVGLIAGRWSLSPQRATAYDMPNKYRNSDGTQ